MLCQRRLGVMSLSDILDLMAPPLSGRYNRSESDCIRNTAKVLIRISAKAYCLFLPLPDFSCKLGSRTKRSQV